MRADEFFGFARERHTIYLRRHAGVPRTQWTSDPVLQRYRFTNVFRELDRTTVWFRWHVRDRLRDKPEVLLATILFRWFNRVETGEAIFLQRTMQYGAPSTPWEFLVGNPDCDAVSELSLAIRAYCGNSGPYVTGSYIIKTPDGMDKLRGVLWCVQQFRTRPTGRPVWQDMAESILRTRNGHSETTHSLQSVWSWLRTFPFMGDFMAYEVVTDLRHTRLLSTAPDIMTWANPGPGAMRGLNRVYGRKLEYRQPREEFIFEMQDLLALSQNEQYWPQFDSDSRTFIGPQAFSGREPLRDWPAWEMRDVEHTLCEFDKYERARLGEGRPRGVFR